MAINEAVNIGINVDGLTSVQQAATTYEDLGDAVAKTQLEAERLAQQFGINDAKTQEAIRVAGAYKQQMEELDFAIDGARGGVDQMFRATQGIIAGFEVAAGAAALFGGENEELEKTLMKVQGAMVFAQGLKDLKEFAPAILSAATALKTQLITAFSTLKGAIASTGIGALIISLGILIQKVSEYNDEIDRTIDRELELARIREKESVESLERSNKAFANSLEYRLLLAEKEGKSQQQIRDLEIKLLKERRTALREFAFDENTSQAERAKALEEYNKISDTVSKKEIQNQIAINAANKEAAEEAKKIAKERTEAEQKRIADKIKADEEAAKKAQEARLKELEDEEFALQSWIEYDTERAEVANANAEYIAKRKKEISDQEIKDQQAKAELEQQLFDQSIALADAIIGIAGEQSAVGKALALAQIGADTAKALSGALANSQSPTPDNIATGGLAGITKYIALAATILTNAKRAYSIIKSPAPSAAVGSSARASVSGGNVPRFQAPSVRIAGGDNEFTQVRRVYVTEFDITNVQQKVKVTEDIGSL